jgi:ferredoxin, 2Fe-2S
MAIIKFNFENKNLAPVEVKASIGDNISEIADENDIHINYNCGRVCACSTCHVYVLKGEEYLAEISDREEDFIDRATNPRINSRLSCQCELTEDSKDLIIEVLVPDQSRIIGHEH